MPRPTAFAGTRVSTMLERLICTGPRLALLLALGVSGRADAQGAAPTASPEGASPPEGADSADETASPDSATQEAYRQVVAEAIVEFDAGRWAEARALFLRAHELWPSARTLRTLGMTSYELRDYPRAVNELKQALSDARRPLTEEQRQHTESLIERANGFLGNYHIELKPVDAQAWVDARPHVIRHGEVLQLGVGSHELVARAPGYTELRRRISVQGGEEVTLRLELMPATAPVIASVATAPATPPPAPVSTKREHPATLDEHSGHGRFWTWVAAGGAVALGGASTALWLQSESDAAPIKSECEPLKGTPDECSEADFDDEGVKRLETAHQITLGLAIAAGLGAVALYVVEGETKAEQTTISLNPGGLSVSGSF